ncbi:MAG: MgtC/SapB family protein [Lachnospiraceae bacterium]|nr:MgtC/SapB family protein [Lachnospiraceae bacterium]
MIKIIDFLEDFNSITVIIRLLCAAVLGGCIGLEREKYKRPAGFRTHILVCIGAAMTSLIAQYIVFNLGITSDAARIPAQVISGLGFLGVGTIFTKGRDHVVGLTTAAGIWTVGAIGIACGFGFYVAACACSVIVLIATSILYTLENDKKERRKNVEIYIEIADAHRVNDFIKILDEKFKAKNFMVVSSRSGKTDNIGIEAIFPINNSQEDNALLDRLVELEDVIYAIESIPKKLS